MSINHIQERGKETVLNEIYRQIQLVYKNDQRPWIIGYSGGKDSTLTVMLVFTAISKLPKDERTKKIHIVSSNTMVENPLILNYLNKNMDLMNEYSKSSYLNITAKLLTPQLQETFWTLLIGKGYPSPRQKFRWCTNRLKIRPIDKYIDTITATYGSAIVLLGVRNAESNSRSESIKQHTVDGRILKTHKTNKNAYVYAPIEHLSNDDVWFCLSNTITPWGFDNNLLLSLYLDASDESECPIQQDTNTPSCGQSRFGCWTCTVVAKDKSLTGFIYNGYDELRPLLSFRDYLYNIRDLEEYRQNYRMDGSIYFVGKGEDSKRGNGPFKLSGRKKILAKLLEAEDSFNKALKESDNNRFSISGSDHYRLIDKKELEIIRKQWIKDGDWEDSLPLIYQKITGKEYYSGYVNQPFFASDDIEILNQICDEEELEVDIIKSLITLENKYLGMKKRSGIIDSIDQILNQDIIHEELIALHRRNQL